MSNNEIAINLNEEVRFKLTDYGREVYSRYLGLEYDDLIKDNDDLFKIFKYVGSQVDENGYCEMQLWKFMQIFGKEMFMGNKEVIKPLEIIYTLEGGETK